MDLIGIDNENGHFPPNFFLEGLDDELAPKRIEWSALGKDAPHNKLRLHAGAHIQAIEQASTIRDFERVTETVRKATYGLLEALGYTYQRESAPIAGGKLVPILARASDHDGRDTLWILEAPYPEDADPTADPLSLAFERMQLPDYSEESRPQEPIEEILGDGIFDAERPPRFVLVVGLRQAILIRRDKWHSRSALRFDLQEIFSRADMDTLTAMAVFLGRETLAPEVGVPYVDRLEEEAQRRANAVTTSLKRTVRDAIELLGQEVLDVTEGKYPKGHPRAGRLVEGEDLAKDCLRYMYRLLFLFYAEANPKLGLAAMNNPVYVSGYSLESLRNLEAVRLSTTAERNGTFLWESLNKLVSLMRDGTGHLKHNKGFVLPGAKVALLHPESTPILSRVSLRNEAMQKILRLLSLKTGRGQAARISYAQLGIGQLGAVYETLISFTGVVAKEDLIEIRAVGGAAQDDDEVASSADDADFEDEVGDDETDDAPEIDRRDAVDLLAPSYFVPRSRAREFGVDRVIYDGTNPRLYPKGTFIYRLAGRDREKTAAYYTPQPLAALLVKHTIMERCKDLSADEILDLKVLEPAMGSAAFIAETVNQLADLYLQRKQEEPGAPNLPQEQYYIERQKVRAYLSDRNAFGVDLNPIATELGAISLWLNSLHGSEFAPWFNDQLVAGNSLIGARRATYASDSLRRTGQNSWLKGLPKEIGWKEQRPSNHVWQFLLPAPGMANFEKEKSIKEFAEPYQEAIKEWRRNGWERPLSETEAKMALRLSKVVDELFEAVADDLAAARNSCNDPITIWPDKHMSGGGDGDFIRKQHHLSVLTGDEHLSNSVPYKRLKMAMDAWCALWLWPLDKAHLLPDRATWFNNLRFILEGGYFGDDEELDADGNAQKDFFDIFEPGEADAIADALPSASRQGEMFQSTDVDGFVEDTPWLRVAREVAQRERFMHFDLAFADILRERGGFDIIIGNPPWAKPSWNEGLVLADIDPVNAGLSASDAKNVLAEALAKAPPQRRSGRHLSATEAFIEDFSITRGAMSVTSSAMMNPHAGSGQNNLYRCFVDLAFRLVSTNGNIGLIHQDGHLKEDKSLFRKNWYERIVKYFEFSNKISSKNFSEVLHTKRFSLNVYRGAPSVVSFEQMVHAFLASQVDDSYMHDGMGPLPLLRTPEGNWNTVGHKNRLCLVTKKELEVFRDLLSPGREVKEARLIQMYSSSLMSALGSFAHLERLCDAVQGVQVEPLFHESGAQKAREIFRETGFADSIGSAILSGPNIYVSNPLYKTPRRNCTKPQHYDNIHLPEIPASYAPRVNYVATEKANLPMSRFFKARPFVDGYRLAFRRRIDLQSERSFTAAIIPPGAKHIAGIHSAAFGEPVELLDICALTSSIPYDFLFKALGKGDIGVSDFESIPSLRLGIEARLRVLALNCLNGEYAGLWDSFVAHDRRADWSVSDRRLVETIDISKEWTWDSPLRTDFARRLALVEVDVLVAMALGWDINQLIDVMRIYFPLLQMNENATWFDQKGQIVWSASRALSGVGWLDDRGKSPGRRAWESLLETNPSELTCEAIDDTQPGGPRTVTRHFVGPFTKCDRVEDYRRAWAHFERLQSDEAA